MHMSKTTLYLFIGYPGAGKTTVADLISKKSGAHHLWADGERHRLFKSPKHSKEESDELYDQLNEATNYLLSQGKSVVFDTNFNFYKDRQKLREIADKNDAETLVVWVNTPEELSYKRAVASEIKRNNYKHTMTHKHFKSIASKLEEPREDENVIKIDGTDLDKDECLKRLGIKLH
jgi:predicted kinase